MAEYIERKRAIVDVCNSLELYSFEYAKLEDALNKIPAADVAPVRHGRWVDTDSEFAQCSLCKYPVYVGWNQTNYCPNCGAKMDGGDGNSDMA